MVLKTGIACGGTGGHIFPGLAVAEVLRSRGHGVQLWMAGKDIENEAMQEWKGSVVTVPSRGFQGHNLFSHIKTFANLLWVEQQCHRMMAADRPDVMLAMGSYASIGPGLACRRLGVPLVLHEANVIPGRAIKMLARHSERIAINFEETSFYLKRKGVDVTGMPLRRDLQVAADSDPQTDDPAKIFTLLVMGGSRGAHALNEICSETVCSLQARGLEFEVIHLTGVDDEKMVRALYDSCKIRGDVHAFHHDMAALYRKCDMAVCRAGASTCAELGAFAVPALLIPYPHAVKNHQMRNAEAMEQRGVADLVAEADLGTEWLAEYLAESISNSARLDPMRNAAIHHRETDGAQKLADLVEETVGI